MGRPLKKDSFGTEVLGSPATTNAGITVSFYDGSSLQTDGIIIKQRGARTFVVARVGTPETRYTCVTQSATPSAEGQMRLIDDLLASAFNFGGEQTAQQETRADIEGRLIACLRTAHAASLS